MIAQILTFLFVLLLPTQFGKHFFLPFSYISGVRVDYLAPTLYALDLIAIVLIILNAHFILKTIKKHLYPFLILLSFFLANIFFSVSPWISLYKSLKILEILGVYLAFRHMRPPHTSIFVALLIGAIFELFLGILQITGGHSIQGVFYFFGERYFSLSTPGIAKATLWGRELLRPYGTFSHPNSIAGFYLLVYVATLTIKKIRISFLLRTAIIFISAAIIFITFSKLAFGVLTLLTAVYLYRSRTITCTLCKIARFAGLVILTLVLCFAQTDPHTLSKRITLVKQSVVVFIEHPATGAGLGAYVAASASQPTRSIDILNQPVHSIYFLWLSEAGILGLVILALLIPALKKYVKLMPYVLAVVLVTGTGDHYWMTLPQNMFLIGALASLV